MQDKNLGIKQELQAADDAGEVRRHFLHALGRAPAQFSKGVEQVHGHWCTLGQPGQPPVTRRRRDEVAEFQAGARRAGPKAEFAGGMTGTRGDVAAVKLNSGKSTRVGRPSGTMYGEP